MNACKNIVNRKVINASLFSKNVRRNFNVSVILNKRYKYALDKKSFRASGSGGTVGSRKKYKNGPAPAFEGRELNYFTFDGKEEHEEDLLPLSAQDIDKLLKNSPKQSAYAEIVESALLSLFSSCELPDCLSAVEIVQVEVSPSLCSAMVVWKIAQFTNQPYTKGDVESTLQEQFTNIRMLLPAHSTVTQTPVVNFVYDEASKRADQMEELFNRIKLQEEEHQKKNENVD